ncbi:MAG TPA: hypothetical protein VNT79_08670 [Phycisphaerae bacterium]|nr:hypothetical protein [Phycisphaerae bacterium]
MSEAVKSILKLIDELPPADRAELVAEVDHTSGSQPRPSLREIQPVSVGRILQPLSPDDDLLQEMSA